VPTGGTSYWGHPLGELALGNMGQDKRRVHAHTHARAPPPPPPAEMLEVEITGGCKKIKPLTDDETQHQRHEGLADHR
jgi:hypothetical protein